MTEKSLKSLLDEVVCPNGCDSDIAIHPEDDTFYYIDRVLPDQDLVENEITVRIPVFYCGECGEGWTGYHAEQLRTAAVSAHRIMKDIDEQLFQKIKSEILDDKDT